MDSVVRSFTDLQSALAIGRDLEAAPSHLVRLIRLFSTEERKTLLSQAVDFYRSIDSGTYGVRQFVGYMLGSEKIIALRPDGWRRKRVRDFPWDSVAKVDISKFEAEGIKVIDAVCGGQAPRPLALILHRTILVDDGFFEENLGVALVSIFKKPIVRPELAAGIAECMRHNRRLTDQFRNEARVVADCARLIPERTFRRAQPEVILDINADSESDPADVPHEVWLPDDSPEHDRETFLHLVKDVEAFASSANLDLIDKMHRELGAGLDLAGRFKFVESQYGILVPSRQVNKISADFENLVAQAMRSKANIRGLSPRQFEEFVADLFRALGYQVELTKCTRDGGVDILCLRSEHGIPLRIAVEVKRYAEHRPITVEMVRSFVGANHQFQADKLVFVTTSSYTRSALEFADRYAARQLSLKDYTQVQEWCATVSKENWSLIS